MTTFKYKALRGGRELYEGVAEAADKFALYREIRARGDTALEAKEFKEKNFIAGFLTGFGRIKTIEKIIMARNLGSMISAGLSLSRALSVLERQARKRRLKGVLSRLSEAVRSGKPFSETLASEPRVFSRLFVAMVRAGEESGRLAESLSSIATQMHSIYLLRKKIRGAMIYPAIIVSVIIIIAILMLIFVVPTLTATFNELKVPLPLNTRIIIAASSFLKDNLILSLSILIILIAGGAFALRLPAVKRLFEFVFLHLPIIGEMTKEANSARTARTLSSLLSAGVDMVFAAGVTAEVLQNSFYREVMERSAEVVARGDPLSRYFLAHEHLYPPFVGEMVSVGEETGKLGELLSGIATHYETEVDQKTKDLSVAIEPILMVIIGAIVGFFAVSMIAPMYSLVNFI
ncbi:MAG: type II secretion system F family protein [Candidatus Taylorbacteria bacterium]|nr:type II secretion system F family protein [Candidatus Taylorbacteria bacterium]